MSKKVAQIFCQITGALLLFALASPISAGATSSRLMRSVGAIKGAFAAFRSAADSLKNTIRGNKIRGSLWAALPASLGAYYMSNRSKCASDAYDHLCEISGGEGLASKVRTWALEEYHLEPHVLKTAVQACRQREEEYARTHQVLYHGQCQNVRMMNDIYTYLLEWECQENYQAFSALRFVPTAPPHTPIPLLHAKNLGLYNTENIPEFDTTPKAVASLLSTNFALNGNHLSPGEHTPYYWIANHSSEETVQYHSVSAMCNFYGLDGTHLQAIRPLKSSHGSLLQIFIPKSVLNKACYVALARGRAYGDKWIKHDEFHVNSEWWVHSENENRHHRTMPLYTCNSTASYPKATGAFPLFDGNETSSDTLRGGALESFCSTNKNFAPFITPSRFLAALKWGLLPREMAQAAQMRLVMGQDIVLNPKVTKIYREDLVQPQAINEYKRQFKSCMHRAMLDWLDRAEKGSLPGEVIERIKDKPVYQLVVNSGKREQERSRLKRELAELDAQNPTKWWHKITRYFA